MEDKDTKWILLILLFSAFTLGWICAEAVYNDVPPTEEEMYELNRSQWYE